MSDFLSLGISPALDQALQHQRVTEPTPIQTLTIPEVLAGRDVIAQAQTGTGKTFAFLLPMLEKIDPARPVLQALIITPTRELAIQITNETKRLLPSVPGSNVLAIYGGKDLDTQVRKLNAGAQIAVGTPGRILDHLRRGTIDLSAIAMLVLDEADQMLLLGFLPDVEAILCQTPTARQTLLFSATIPAQVKSLARQYLRDPKDIRVQNKTVTVEAVRQIVVPTTDRTKQETLRRLIDEYRPFLAIIFCRTKRRASALCDALQEHGYLVDQLHGDLSQRAREQVIRRFRSAKLQLLVATDVAARGLDVEGITHVFNYDIPHDVESYIHRIGRTGRAGDTGLAVTLAAPKDNYFLAIIEKGLQTSIERQQADPLAAPTDASRPRRAADAPRAPRPAEAKERENRNQAGGGRGQRRDHPRGKSPARARRSRGR